MVIPRKVKPKEVITEGLPKGSDLKHLLLQQPHGLKEDTAPHPKFQTRSEKTGWVTRPVGRPVNHMPSPVAPLPVTASVLYDPQLRVASRGRDPST